jgi:ABC-2 type transport system ATP-binding protein
MGEKFMSFSDNPAKEGLGKFLWNSVRQNFVEALQIYCLPLLEMARDEKFGEFLLHSLRDNLISSARLYFFFPIFGAADIVNALKSILADKSDRERVPPRNNNNPDRSDGHHGTVPSADSVIEAEGLTKRYNGAAAVDHVSFNVSRGEIFGLLGPNGAGKTTTILMLLGLTDLSEGKARVLGHDPEREPLAVKRRVGYLPDSVGFYDHMTAAENLRYTARLMGMREAEREGRMAAALRRVELTEVADNRVATFSRGMRQRLGLAEILMKEAAVAILDEPTSGLDPQATLELLDMIRALKREGVSVLLSSHLLDRVQSVCDRVALFQAGKIVLIGTVAELGRQVLGGGFAVEVEAQGSGLAERLREVPGVTAVEQRGPDRVRLLADRDVRPQAAAAVVAAGGQLLRLSVEEPSLEMIYTRYFQEHGAQHAA